MFMSVNMLSLGLIKFNIFSHYLFVLSHRLSWMKSGSLIGAIGLIISFSAAIYMESHHGELLPAEESLLEGMLPCHVLKFAPFSIPTGVVGMLFDWYLLILAIPAVWTLKMSLSKKVVGITLIMTGGL
jgi:hypothetical protein